MLSTWKIADVFVTFKNWGHLKELLHFWCCQVQKLTKSRRIASFSNLSFSNDNYNYNYNCDHATLHTLRYTNYTTTTTRNTTTTTTTLDYTTLDYTTERNATAHYTTLHCTTRITPHQNYNCNCATLITVHYSYNSTTLQLQLQLQLRYTTLHPAVVGEVATATIATTPKNTTPTTFRSISGFALPSMHSVLSLKLPPRPCAALLV